MHEDKKSINKRLAKERSEELPVPLRGLEMLILGLGPEKMTSSEKKKIEEQLIELRDWAENQYIYNKTNELLLLIQTS